MVIQWLSKVCSMCSMCVVRYYTGLSRVSRGIEYICVVCVVPPHILLYFYSFLYEFRDASGRFYANMLHMLHMLHKPPKTHASRGIELCSNVLHRVLHRHRKRRKPPSLVKKTALHTTGIPKVAK